MIPWVPLIITGSGAVVFLGLFLLVRRALNARREVLDKLGGVSQVELIDAMANLRAVESRGLIQVSGNGCLGMGPEELIFIMWWPRREIRIRRADIVGVETPRAFMGKFSGAPMLKVKWRNEGGETDSAAWLVRDRQAWIQSLQQSSRPPS